MEKESIKKEKDIKSIILIVALIEALLIISFLVYKYM